MRYPVVGGVLRITARSVDLREVTRWSVGVTPSSSSSSTSVRSRIGSFVGLDSFHRVDGVDGDILLLVFVLL